MAYTAFDGFLRIYNYSTLTPQLLVKSDFGGFNSMAVSSDQSLLTACGQDDSITIINLKTLNGFKIEAHKSFVTNSIFLNNIS